MSDYVTIGRRHDRDTWELVFGPDAARESHKNFYNANRFSKHHRTYAETWLLGINGIRKKTFNRDTLEEIDSSSSESSSSSSLSESSESSSSSVNSSSSSSSSVNSSSSSSSTDSSSSSS